MGGYIKSAEHEINKLDARCAPIERSLDLMRTDITSIERDMTKTEHKVHELQSSKESMEAVTQYLERRMTDLETDGRIDKLMELPPRVAEIEKQQRTDQVENLYRLTTLDDQATDSIL